MKKRLFPLLSLLLAFGLLFSSCSDLALDIADTVLSTVLSDEETGAGESALTGEESDPEDAQDVSGEDVQDAEPSYPPEDSGSIPSSDTQIDRDGTYTTPHEVAAYIHLYGTLPKNFITKSDASALGWKSSEGNLWEVTDHMSIGGDKFGNREGLLPKADGRQWYECDVNYEGGYRGAERILYSNDGLIYYTDDHYETFTQLYDAEGEVSP